MTTLALGIALIVIGVALVCAGLILWPRAPHADPAAPDDDGLRGMRAIVEALEQEDRAERDAMTNVRPRLDQIRNEDSSK
jgi:hypothetical protein